MGSPLGVRMPRRGTAKRSWPSPATNDANCILLLHGGGANGSTTFQDESFAGNNGNGASITNQNGTGYSTAQSKLTTSSIRFNGTNQSLTWAARQADIQFGSGEFNIGMFFKADNPNTSQGVLCTTAGGAASACSFHLEQANNKVHFNFYYDAANSIVSVETAMSDTNWHWAEVCRDYNTLRLYLDGVQGASADLTGKSMNGGTNPLVFGSYYSYNIWWGGYLEEIYISNICRHRSGTSYAPPTSQIGPNAR